MYAPLSRRAVLAGLAATSTTAVLAGCTAPAAGNATPTASAGDVGHYLITGGTVLTMIDGAATTSAADVLVRDGVIVAIGPSLDAHGAEVIDAADRIVMPGLVDTHWHMWNTIARGWASSELGGFSKTMAALSPNFAAGDSALGVRLALAEAVGSGITTVHNWAHNIRSPAHAEAELAAMTESGLRGRFAYGYPQDAATGETMDFAHLAELAGMKRGGLISLGICTRGPDRSDPSVWAAEWDTARELGLPITTHLASDATAAALGGIGALEARGGLGPDVQLVHLTGASADDIARVVAAGSPVSISPWTELEVGYGLPPIEDLAAAGASVGLSVDNTVLAGSADMFSVLKLTADLAAGMAARQSVLPDALVLDWATRTGAATIGLGDTVGTLEVGKRADLITVRTDALNTAPSAGAAALLTHAARPENVDLVLIDGVVHKREGRLTRVDVAALLGEAEESMARIRTAAGL